MAFETKEQQEAFELGIACYAAYISGCGRNYPNNPLSTQGAFDYVGEVLKFVAGKQNYISNKNNVTFEVFSKRYIEAKYNKEKDNK